MERPQFESTVFDAAVAAGAARTPAELIEALEGDDDRRRELIQKTILGSLNRTKETIARIETAGIVAWRLN